MRTAIKLDPARELGIAIRLMALRMVYTERDINRGVFLAPTGEPFMKTAEGQRLRNRYRYQDKALARLVYALTDLAGAPKRAYDPDFADRLANRSER